MTATAIRWAAIPFGLLACGLRIALSYLPFGEAFDFLVAIRSVDFYTVRAAQGVIAGSLVVAGLCYGLPVALYLLATRVLRRPARLVPRGHRLVAVASPHTPGTQVIMLMFFGGGALVPELLAESWLFVLAAFPFFLGIVAFLAWPGPSVELDANGITVRQWLQVTHLRWTYLMVDGPLPATVRRRGDLRIYQWTAYGPRAVHLPFNLLYVDPVHLGRTIHHYIAEPGARASIAAGPTPAVVPVPA
ncbi:hypothetical protein ACFQX7_38590 [Luedemannella flava]